MEQDIIKFLTEGGTLAIVLYACVTLWKAYQQSVNARIEDLKHEQREDVESAQIKT